MNCCQLPQPDAASAPCMPFSRREADAALQTHLLLDRDRRLTGLAGPDNDATISFGLPFESEDCPYGKYRYITMSVITIPMLRYGQDVVQGRRFLLPVAVSHQLKASSLHPKRMGL